MTTALSTIQFWPCGFDILSLKNTFGKRHTVICDWETLPHSPLFVINGPQLQYFRALFPPVPKLPPGNERYRSSPGGGRAIQLLPPEGGGREGGRSASGQQVRANISRLAPSPTLPLRGRGIGRPFFAFSA
ncbi:MAG TPA: hypothetical protein DCZ75_06245 [Geobacter sp.]|nr:hypothetical protein [Geobacter sp.]